MLKHSVKCPESKDWPRLLGPILNPHKRWPISEDTGLTLVLIPFVHDLFLIGNRVMTDLLHPASIPIHWWGSTEKIRADTKPSPPCLYTTRFSFENPLSHPKPPMPCLKIVLAGSKGSLGLQNHSALWLLPWSQSCMLAQRELMELWRRQSLTLFPGLQDFQNLVSSVDSR